MAIKLIWHWFTLGPYHFARMSALARQPGIDLTVVETSSVDDHSWQRGPLNADFACISLTNGRSERVFHETRRDLRRVIEGVRPDAIVTSGYGEPNSRECCAGYVRKHRSTALLLWSESSVRDNPRTFWKESLKRIYLRCFDGALVAGAPHALYMLGLGMPAGRIQVVGGCVDNDYFLRRAAEARETPGLRSELGLPERYFLFVGRLIWQKNLPILLEAFRRYRRDSGAAPWDLVIAGNGPLESELRAQAGEGVHFAGMKQIEQLPPIYAFAGCFVMASVSDSWGLVVNEAMASGLPVIASNGCGCAEDLVAAGVNGFRFEPADTDALAGHMARIASGGLDLAAMGAASQERVGRFHLSRFGAAAADHVRGLCSSAPARPSPRGTALSFAVAGAAGALERLVRLRF
jgi:glycosyltransferase involved in cell wall biosynthesis